MKQKLLLHSCCAPCSGYLVSELADNFEVTVYYNNPNIYPASEYQTRKNEAKNFFGASGIKFIEQQYDHGSWLKITKDLANEPERGKRCILCYHLRLEGAAKYAKENNYDLFSATLSISPHKDAKILSNLGRAISKKISIGFIDENWKKKDRFKKAMDFSHAHDFYHQNYCGCEFSKR